MKYFAIQLLCSKMIHTQEIPAKEELTSYDKQLKQFVHKIISVISDIMNVDLMDDNELYYGLLNHIRPAIFRIDVYKRQRFKRECQILNNQIKTRLIFFYPSIFQYSLRLQ